jgi:prophage DNA circulation protein
MSGSLAGLGAAIIGSGTVGGSFARFLRPASLRGVGFWVDASDDSAGRRWVTHEFPGRDDPWHEDLGLGVDAIGVEGLLIGDDVTRQADRLRRAARAAGPARLVHPWYGSIQVAVLGCDLSFDTGQGRVARFRLRLQRYGAQPAPALGGGLIARVLDAVDDVASTIADTLAELRGALALPDAAIATVLGIAGGLGTAIAGGLGAAGLATVLGSTAAGRAIAGLSGMQAGQVTPTAVAAQAGAAAAAIAALPPDAGASPNAPLLALLSLAEAPGLVAVPADRSTPQAALVADVAREIDVAVRAELAARAAAAALAAGWDSQDDAMADRDRLAAALDAAGEGAAVVGWDDAWRALAALRAASLAEIAARAAPLPRLRRLTLPAALPACLLAYDLDADAIGNVFVRGEQIAARNGARHPGFLAAGGPIDVLV